MIAIYAIRAHGCFAVTLHAYVDSIIHGTYNISSKYDTLARRVSLLVRSFTFRICDPLIFAHLRLALAKCTRRVRFIISIMRKRSLLTVCCINDVMLQLHTQAGIFTWSNGFYWSNKLDNRVARSLLRKRPLRRQAQKAGDYFWPQSIPNPVPRSSDIRKNPAYDGNVCDCRYRFRSQWFSAISEIARSWRGRARVCSILFSLSFPPLFLFLMFAQTGYPRYFSTRSFVTRNDRFFVLLCPLVFHCPYLLSLFLPDAAVAPPHFHAFDLTTHIPPPMYLR